MRMLPSMYSPVDSDIYPPDVCYSGDTSPSLGWNLAVEPGLEAIVEQATIMETHQSEDIITRLEQVGIQNTSTLDDELLEGAVGGSLPDLCVTGSIASSQRLDAVSESLSNQSQKAVLNISKDSANSTNTNDVISGIQTEKLNDNSEDSMECSYLARQKLEMNNLECDRTNNANDFLVHSCKHICLVACGTGDIHKDVLHAGQESHLGVLCPDLNLCCDKLGALEKLNDLQTYGLDLVCQNLVQSSHAMYHNWECSAFIPSDFLSPISMHSHGTPLGCDIGSAYILGFPFGRHPMNEAGPQLPEEEQIKVAKRFGLIQHLPCGIFNGSTKTRECVICMIDFSVGEKIRYLPCMHTYHTDCIDDWLMRSFTCPSCLEPVDAALLNTYETS